MRYRRDRDNSLLTNAINGLGECIKNLEEAEDIASLQGIEGYGSRLYYGAFKELLKQDLGFKARVKRPPTDPINSLLSFGYTLLVYNIQAAVSTVGLDPFLGFYHATEYSRPSLVLDLMEEFRPIIVDSIVLRLINNQIMDKEDFESPDSMMVLLKKESIKKFIKYYEERVQTLVYHPLIGREISYRRCFEIQARQLSRVILGQEPYYKPFLVR